MDILQNYFYLLVRLEVYISVHFKGIVFFPEHVGTEYIYIFKVGLALKTSGKRGLAIFKTLVSTELKNRFD